MCFPNGALQQSPKTPLHEGSPRPRPLLPITVAAAGFSFWRIIRLCRNRLRRCALAWKVTQETPSQFRVVHRFGRPTRRENEETENKVGPNAPRRPLFRCRVCCAHGFFPGGGLRCVDSWQPPCCRHGPTGPTLDRSIIYASSGLRTHSSRTI
jgi:hypothetical protein